MLLDFGVLLLLPLLLLVLLVDAAGGASLCVTDGRSATAATSCAVRCWRVSCFALICCNSLCICVRLRRSLASCEEAASAAPVLLVALDPPPPGAVVRAAVVWGVQLLMRGCAGMRNDLGRESPARSGSLQRGNSEGQGRSGSAEEGALWRRSVGPDAPPTLRARSIAALVLSIRTSRSHCAGALVSSGLCDHTDIRGCIKPQRCRYAK